jgi:pimeloyl-ACP methyl ester carboxylesterase
MSLASVGCLLGCGGTGGAWPGPALAPNFADPGWDPDASFTYAGSSLIYSSTIDSGLTNLQAGYVYDLGRAAVVGTRGPMPQCLFIHGYNGSSANISDTVMFRAASMGFLAGRINMRAEVAPSIFRRDDGVRENYDIMDFVSAIVALLPSLVSRRRVLVGYSGGGYNVLCDSARVLSAEVLCRTCLFCWGDDGESSDPTVSYWAEGDSSAEVINRVGPRTGDMGPYKVRNMLRTVAGPQLTSAPLIMLWDVSDPIGKLLRPMRQKFEDTPSPVSRYFAQESGPGSPYRWYHGYFEDNPDLIHAEYASYAFRNAGPSEVAQQGDLTVMGWCKHDDFEVWTAPIGEANPRSLSPASSGLSPNGGAGGGQRYLADLVYDADAEKFVVAPNADTGPCAVEVRMGDGRRIVQDVSSSTVFQF